MNMLYSELSDNERESDRHQADKVAAAIRASDGGESEAIQADGWLSPTEAEARKMQAGNLTAALREAIKAIESLPEDTLGMANEENRYQWPIRNELLNNLRIILLRWGETAAAIRATDNDICPICGNPESEHRILFQCPGTYPDVAAAIGASDSDESEE